MCRNTAPCSTPLPTHSSSLFRELFLHFAVKILIPLQSHIPVCSACPSPRSRGAATLPSSSLAEHTNVHLKGRRPKHFTFISLDGSKEKPFVSRKSVYTHTQATAGFPTRVPSIWLTVERAGIHTNSQVFLIVPFCQKMLLAQRELHKSTDRRITTKFISLSPAADALMGSLPTKSPPAVPLHPDRQ